MSNPVPDLLALTSIADGSPRNAAPVRNNFSAIQTAVNALKTAIGGGAAGQVLTSAGPDAVAWGTAPALTVLDDLTVTGSGLASYDTNARLSGNIPQTHKDLVLSIKGRSDQATVQQCLVQINGDTGASSYLFQDSYAAGATQTDGESLAANGIRVGYIGSTAGIGGVIEAEFPNYTDSVLVSMVLSRYFSAHNNSTGTLRVGQVGGYRSAAAAAITRIVASPGSGNFAVGTRFTLYGRG